MNLVALIVLGLFYVGGTALIAAGVLAQLVAEARARRDAPAVYALLCLGSDDTYATWSSAAHSFDAAYEGIKKVNRLAPRKVYRASYQFYLWSRVCDLANEADGN